MRISWTLLHLTEAELLRICQAAASKAEAPAARRNKRPRSSEAALADKRVEIIVLDDSDDEALLPIHDSAMRRLKAKMVKGGAAAVLKEATGKRNVMLGQGRKRERKG